MIQLISIFPCLNCILFTFFSKTFVFDYSLIISRVNLRQSFKISNGEKNGSILLTGSNNRLRNYESWIFTNLLTNEKKPTTNKQNEIIKLVLIDKEKSWKFESQVSKLIDELGEQDVGQQTHLNIHKKITWKYHSTCWIFG